MPYSCLIWDFNGTILDDVKTGIDSVNVLLEKRGLPLIDGVEKYHAVFGFPIIEYYKRLGFDFEKESYDALAHEWVDVYNELVKKAPLRDGVLTALEEIKRFGIPQIILSATEKNMLISQVKSLGIYDYFDEILGMDNIYAYSKRKMAVEWMQKRNIKNALMVGDTTHDAEVAASMGADCVLVSGGHQSNKTLSLCKNPIVNISELPKIVIS